MSEQQVVDCILNAYKRSGLSQPGSGLRAKITRATNNARAGIHPSKVYTAEQILRDPSRCFSGHVEGITYFTSNVDHTKSPLYVGSYELGKKEISPALVEARRRRGQSKEEFGLRTATRRVGKQPEERAAIQGTQSASWERLQSAFRAGPSKRASSVKDSRTTVPVVKQVSASRQKYHVPDARSQSEDPFAGLFGESTKSGPPVRTPGRQFPAQSADPFAGLFGGRRDASRRRR